MMPVHCSGGTPSGEERGATRLAHGLVRWRWVVLWGWAALSVAAVVGVPGSTHQEDDRLDVRGGSLQPTEAARVAGVLRTRFRTDLGETFLVLLSGPSPFDQPRSRLVLDSIVATLRRQPYVREADTVLLSADRRTALTLLTLNVSDPDSVLRLVQPIRALARQTLAAGADGPGYRVLVTGDTPLERDMLTVTTEDVRRMEWRLVALTALLLVIILGSVVTAMIPLVVGVLAIVVSLAIIRVLAAVTPMSVYVLHVTTMIGLGVGIDYSLLLIRRFREEIDRGLAPHHAVIQTVITAGRTVVISGLIVAVGFAGLLTTSLIETRSIGLGGMIVVAIAVLLAVTLVPALLAVVPVGIGRPAPLLARYRSRPVWERWAHLVARHPVGALAAGALVIATFSAPLAGIRVGLPARYWWPSGTEAGEGLDVLRDLGQAGAAQPVRVLVEFPDGRTAVQGRSLRVLRALSDSLRADARVHEVRSLVDFRPHTSVLEYAFLYSDLAGMRARYARWMDASLSTDARVARLDVILADTTSLPSAAQVVRHARDLAANRSGVFHDARILVGGYVAENLDFQDAMLRVFPLMAGAIFLATALVLALVFRSVLVPLKAVLLNLLSVSATFGLIVLVFQHGVGGRLFGLAGPPGAVFVAIPVLVFAVVFGLSMDYEVFLLGRIKEEFDRTNDNSAATIAGLTATASVITPAALLMIVVFGAFAFTRVLVIQVLGFGLAVAVLLDATVIRLVMVPALMYLAGRWNWWPGVRQGPRA